MPEKKMTPEELAIIDDPGLAHLSLEERINEIRVRAMDAQVAAGQGGAVVGMTTGVQATQDTEPQNDGSPDPSTEKAPARGKPNK